MKKLTIISLTLILTAGLLWLNGCKKETAVQQQNTTVTDNEANEAMLQHVLDFKQRMENYKEHPGIRSEEKEQSDATVNYWESSINLTYCHSYLELSDAAVYDTVIAMPPITQDSILMANIADKYYNEILYTVKAQYLQAPFTNETKKLMVVDLERTTGGDSLQIKTMVGNTLSMTHPPYDWKYGEKLGTCDGQHDVGVWDAAHEIAKNTRNDFYEAPPTNCHWWFYNIQTIFVDDPTLYPNPNDPPPANYEDYLIYYASSALGVITDDVLCLEHYDELAFYKQSYINLTNDWINNSGGKKFKDCEYNGIHVIDNNHNIHFYKHQLTTFLGYRTIVCDISIDDISQY